MTFEKSPYFIDPAFAPMLSPMPGLETTILTGLHGERMMMVLNATLPGHAVPMHSHPHEQIGTVSQQLRERSQSHESHFTRRKYSTSR